MKYGDVRKVRRYRKFLYASFLIACMALVVAEYSAIYHKVPNTIKLRVGEEENIDFQVPASGIVYKDAFAVSGMPESNIPKEAIHFDLDEPVTLKANQEDTYNMDVKLFGVFPLKTVELQVIKEQNLIPAGIPIGIYVKTQGVLVIGTGSFQGEDGNTHEPARHILKSGDYIRAINGQKIGSKKQVIEIIQGGEGKEAILTVERGGEEMDLKIVPQKSEEGGYKLGIWIRDSAQGIGTLTFVNEQGEFGALGHGINDVDTSTLMDMEGGTLYQTSIVGIRRGQRGTPGELTGTIDYSKDNIIGTITNNTDNGIFGQCNEELLFDLKSEPMPIALKQEVKPGPAQILCNIDGEATYYDVEIMELNHNSGNVNRGIVLKITDEDLLALTGGIVQGMSGSPIIQNGKLVGAVTHVLVQDATKGYGIFIESMLK